MQKEAKQTFILTVGMITEFSKQNPDEGLLFPAGTKVIVESSAGPNGDDPGFFVEKKGWLLEVRGEDEFYGDRLFLKFLKANYPEVFL